MTANKTARENLLLNTCLPKPRAPAEMVQEGEGDRHMEASRENEEMKRTPLAGRGSEAGRSGGGIGVPALRGGSRVSDRMAGKWASRSSDLPTLTKTPGDHLAETARLQTSRAQEALNSGHLSSAQRASLTFECQYSNPKPDVTWGHQNRNPNNNDFGTLSNSMRQKPGDLCDLI